MITLKTSGAFFVTAGIFLIIAVLFFFLFRSHQERAKTVKDRIKGIVILVTSLIWAICGVYIFKMQKVFQTTGIPPVQLDYLFDIPFLCLISFIGGMIYIQEKD